jgi:aminopeptidase YwaD
MRAKFAVLIGTFCLVCAVGILRGQEKEDRTLLSQQQMTAIINEVSGERAMHHVLELVPLPAS